MHQQRVLVCVALVVALVLALSGLRVASASPVVNARTQHRAATTTATPSSSVDDQLTDDDSSDSSSSAALLEADSEAESDEAEEGESDYAGEDRRANAAAHHAFRVQRQPIWGDEHTDAEGESSDAAVTEDRDADDSADLALLEQDEGEDEEELVIDETEAADEEADEADDEEAESSADALLQLQIRRRATAHSRRERRRSDPRIAMSLLEELNDLAHHHRQHDRHRDRQHAQQQADAAADAESHELAHQQHRMPLAARGRGRGRGRAQLSSKSSAEAAVQARTWQRMVSEARNYHSQGVKGGACAGVISANCKETADMQGSIPTAAQWQDECKKLICNPLCLRYTWDVSISSSGGPGELDDQVNAPGMQISLGAQFRAHACGKTLGCCEENEDLLDWVENRNFAGLFPQSPIPAAACQLKAIGDDKDELCSKCKAAISVEAEPKEDVCDYFVKVPDPADMGDESEVFARNMKSAASEIPKQKSFQEKCKAVQGLLAGTISGLASGDWKEKACDCLGCCEASPGSECYYPVVYGTNEEAHDAHKS